MQAYTVELEAELNLLKEENEKLKQVLVYNTEIEYSVLFFSSYFLFFFLHDLCLLMLYIYLHLNMKKAEAESKRKQEASD